MQFLDFFSPVHKRAILQSVILPLKETFLPYALPMQSAAQQLF